MENLPQLETLLRVRKQLAYGAQHDYFDEANCIGWTREGDQEHENSGCAILLSNHENAEKLMFVGTQHAGRTFSDFLGNISDTVIIDEEGNGLFKTNGRSVSVWCVQ
jgi:alpha-amylase